MDIAMLCLMCALVNGIMIHRLWVERLPNGLEFKSICECKTLKGGFCFGKVLGLGKKIASIIFIFTLYMRNFIRLCTSDTIYVHHDLSSTSGQWQCQC